MRSIVKYSACLVIIIAVYAAVLSGAYADENSPGEISSQKYFYFFPKVGIQLEERIFKDNAAGYRLEPHKIIDLDIFRFHSIILSLYMNEFLIFTNKADHIKPESINYEMDYANLRWENRYGILALFVDHNCTNIFNEYATKERQIRWYGLGLRWESYGMKPGRKDERSGGIFDNLHYRISVSKALHTQVLNYDYYATGTLRLDFFHDFFIVPYIESSVTSVIDERARYNKYLETGLRVRFENGSLTPFVGFNHKYDIDYYNTKAVDFYFAGLRMETLLSGYREFEYKPGKSAIDSSLFPEFHFKGAYGKFINDDNLNFYTNISVGLDFLSDYKLSPFIYYTLAHNSQKADTGMFPRYIKQDAEGGVSYKSDFINALIEPYYRYFRNDEGNYYKGYTERYSSAGLRIQSRNMKTGYANKGIDFDSPENLESINTIDWMVSAERVFNKFYYDYDWECGILARWNIFRYRKIIPFMSAGIRFLIDENSDEIYTLESGLRIQTGLQWILFCRFEHRTAVSPGNGLFRDYTLIGVRFEI